MAKKRSTRGGRREGAGRPKMLDDPAKLSIILEGDMLEQLKTAAAEDGINLSEWVRQAIDGALHHCRVTNALRQRS